MSSKNAVQESNSRWMGWVKVKGKAIPVRGRGDP
jgi:hypothetical protein